MGTDARGHCYGDVGRGTVTTRFFGSDPHPRSEERVSFATEVEYLGPFDERSRRYPRL